ncbi:MAG: alpha/beta fold hydrolase, partial [Lachnospiraceae bacterium]|nr:alpha/beta fold hydrolase [Lachnospiraceae bacterium]
YISGFIIFNILMKPRRDRKFIKKQKNDNSEKLKLYRIFMSEIYQEISIINKEDNSLWTGYLYSENKTAIWVMCIHGYGSRATRMIKYMEHFRELGFNVLAIDLRGHGKNSKKYCGLGFLDAYDVLRWSEWIHEKYNPKAKIILFGISMGGATALTAAGKFPNKFSAIISDSAPSSFPVMIKRIVKHRIGIIVNFLFPIITFYVQIFGKFSLSDAEAIKYTPFLNCPVVLIHGSDDGFVLINMMHELYDSIVYENKKKLIIDKAEHTHAVDVNAELYWSTIDNFLEENGFLEK